MQIKHQLGLIGKSLAHSYSGKYFAQKFKKEGISAWEYHLFELDDISLLPALISAHNLIGFNVTIPYKKVVIPYCQVLDPEAAQIGAVNCVHIKNGILYGHNTDAPGFLESIRPVLGLYKPHALIFGSGGASNAVQHALKSVNVTFQIVSTQPKDGFIPYSTIDAALLNSAGFLINTTPLGMYPLNHRLSIPLPYHLIHQAHCCIDLIYNPKETIYLKECRKQGAYTINGLGMLKMQAAMSWQIWQKNIQ